MDEDERFFKEEVPRILERLENTAQPKWGILQPQHMIEHLVGSWRISNGNAKAPLVTPEEQLPAYRKFLDSDQLFEKNMKNPVMGEGLVPLRKKSLDDAREQLVTEINDFFSYFEQHPDVTPMHPIFGELDKKGWLTFQKKHMMHHFRQFGLVDGDSYRLLLP